jgi:hypothetical protein
MMLMALFSIGIALGLFALLFWLVFRPLPSVRSAAGITERLELEELFPLHCRHFPQIRQALSAADQAFLRQRASRQTYQSWKTNRRRAIRSFLGGLREDFASLERLARAVSALSPEISQTREAQQLWFSLRFRLLYHLVSLRMLMGTASLPQLIRLTQMVGSFAAQIEAGMAALEESSASGLPDTFDV